MGNPGLPAVPPLLLDYASPLATVPSRRLMAWGMISASIAAITPWVPFVAGTSPWSVVMERCGQALSHGLDDSLWLLVLAAPFFTAPLICLWKLRMVTRPQTAVPGRAVPWVIALTSLSATFACLGDLIETWVEDADWPSSLLSVEGLVLAGPLTMAAMGLAATWWLHRHQLAGPTSALAALHTAWTTNAVFGLIVLSWLGPDFGWWLTLAAAIAMTAETTAHVILARRRYAPLFGASAQSV